MNVQSDTVPYLAVLAAEKAFLLLFGTAMSFGTRKVSSTFNESHSVAWSIYNVIFATIVIIPIIAFVGALGDMMLLLELFLIIWIALCTWGFVFSTKIYTVFQGEQAEQFSHLESQRTYTGGFSFVSVDALTKQTIDAYLQALSAHMKAVQARKARIDGKATAIAVADEPSQSEKRVVSSGTHRKNDNRSSKSPEMPSKREISNTNPKSLDYASSTPTSRSLYEQRPSMPNEPSTLLTANGNTAGKFLPSTANAQGYALRHTTSHTEVMKKSSLATNCHVSTGRHNGSSAKYNCYCSLIVTW